MKIQLVLTLVSLNNWYSEDKTTAKSFVSSPFEIHTLFNPNFNLALFNYINHKVLYDDLYLDSIYFDKAIQNLKACTDREQLNLFFYSRSVVKDKVLLINANFVEESTFKFSDLTWEEK